MGIMGWSTIGLGAVLVGLAGAFGGLAAKAKSTVEDAELGTHWGNELQGPYEDYDGYVIGAWVSAGVAAAALVTGVTLLVLSRRGRRVERVTVTPTLLPGGGSLTLHARF
jgi:hypothetical protein